VCELIVERMISGRRIRFSGKDTEDTVSENSLARFVKHSAIYSVGNLIYRGGAFFLIPLYAHVLTPAEYGTLEVYSVTALLLQSLLGAGLAHALLRFFFEYESLREKQVLVSTVLFASFGVTMIGAAAFWPVAPFLSELLFGAPVHALAFRLVSCGLVFEISRELNLAIIRAREKSGYFVSVAVVQLVIQVAANVVTVVYLQLGAVGVLLGNLVATVVVWALLSFSTLRFCGLNFAPMRLPEVLRYAVPLMLNGMFQSFVQTSDRYVLLAFGNLAAVGSYALGMRFAMVLNVMVLDPFMKSFGPFRFSIMTRADAGNVYSRILLYFAFLMAAAVLVIAVFSEEVVSLVSSESYSGVAALVPLLVAYPAISGVGYVFQTGIFVSKRTKYILYIGMVSGTALISLNLLMIPYFGATGAAVARIFQSLIAAGLTLVVAQRVRRIRFTFKGLPRIVLSATAAILLALYVPNTALSVSLALKTCIVVGFLWIAAPREHGLTLRTLVSSLRSALAS
jgi:O-antigen/teichoic acid export membrane protein